MKSDKNPSEIIEFSRLNALNLEAANDQVQNFIFAVIQKVRPACVTPDTDDPLWK